MPVSVSAVGSDRELRAAYGEENLVLCARGARAVLWLGIVLLPVFTLVDYSRFPAVAPILGIERALYLLALLFFLWLLRTPIGARNPRGLILAQTMLGGLVIFVMMSHTGGHASPYYAGIGLSMLGAALLMPWPPLWTWLTCGVLMGTYVAYAAVEPIGDGRMFANNLFSYLATALIAGFATVGRERLRRTEFATRFALEKSEARLKEEAATSAALARAGHEMIRSLETPLVLERLCQLTTDLLECDVSHTILWDEQRQVWRAGCQYGDSAEHWRELRSIEVAPGDAAPMIERLTSRGSLGLDVTAETGAWAKAALETGLTHSLWVPLRRGDHVVGVLTAAYRNRPGEFSQRQDRIARGIAQLASMALDNARLHGELARQSEAERRASHAKDEFLATLSHELRTPLNVILGFAEVLRDHDLEPHERVDAEQRIEAAGRRLLEMIDGILEVTRIQSGQLELPLEEIDLTCFWQDLRLRCHDLPRGPAVSLRWLEQVPPLSLRSDARKLVTILRNLIGNALKFTEHGRVEVAAERRRDGLEFKIADTGIGIPDECRDRIFGMFEQLDSSNTRRHGGVGLGLYIVRRFCMQLGLEVCVESCSGGGSLFIVTVPGALVTPLCGTGSHPPTAFREELAEDSTPG